MFNVVIVLFSLIEILIDIVDIETKVCFNPSIYSKLFI